MHLRSQQTACTDEGQSMWNQQATGGGGQRGQVQKANEKALGRERGSGTS